MALLHLSARTRQILQRIARSNADAREVRRAQILLWLNAHQAVQEIAQRLGRTRQAIYVAVGKLTFHTTACAEHSCSHLQVVEKSSLPTVTFMRWCSAITHDTLCRSQSGFEMSLGRVVQPPKVNEPCR